MANAHYYVSSLGDMLNPSLFVHLFAAEPLIIIKAQHHLGHPVLVPLLSSAVVLTRAPSARDIPYNNISSSSIAVVP